MPPGGKFSHSVRPLPASGVLIDVRLPRLLLRQPTQLCSDLLARQRGDRPGTVRVVAVHQLGGLRKPAVEADETRRQQLPAAPPCLADRARVHVVLGQPVDVFDRLADPLHPAAQPGLLSSDPFCPGFADSLPGVVQPGQRRDRGHPGGNITDRQEYVDSGHTSIIPPRTDATIMIL